MDNDSTWGKAPLSWLRKVRDGSVRPSEAAVGSAIAFHHGTLSCAQLATVTGLSVSTVNYALRGRPGRPSGLSSWVAKVGRNWNWTSVAKFARIGWTELCALAAKPTREAIQVWAYVTLHLETARPWTRMKLDVRHAAKATGMTPHRVRRAVYGAAGRLGAVAKGLLEPRGGFFLRRNGIRRDNGRQLTYTTREGDPRVEERTIRQCDPPRVRVESSSTYYQEHLRRRQVLLEDLARDWSRANNHGGTVEGFAEFLQQGRTGEHRKRTWARGILETVLERVKPPPPDPHEARAKAMEEVIELALSSGEVPRATAAKARKLTKRSQNPGRAGRRALERLLDLYHHHLEQYIGGRA